ncbi:MAG: sortase domain-containing protein [Nocardioidaceae bacterium]
MTQRRKRRDGRRGIAVPAAIVAVLAVMALGLGRGLIGDNDPAPAATSPSQTPTEPTNTDKPTTPAEKKKTEHTLQLERSRPRTLSIPAIKVHQHLMKLSEQKGKHLVTLPPRRKAGWYDGSVTPGEVGVSVIIGYIRRSTTKPGVFSHLADLQKKDTISLRRKNGSVAVFRVTEIASYKKGKLPTSKVYADTQRPELRIITCGGTMHRKDPPGSAVVYAKLVNTRHTGVEAD